MGLDSASEIGRVIGGLSNDTRQIQEDHVAQDINQSLILTPIDKVNVQTTVTIIKHEYLSDAFILDHPVYGELDNSTLELDGGYLQTEVGDQFPLSFPIDFDEQSTTGSTILGVYTG